MSTALSSTACDPKTWSESTHAFHKKLISMMDGAPKWYEVGAQKYRVMREAGETPLPASTLLDSCKDIEIPSRDSGRSIPCRLVKPKSGSSHHTYMHIHGGGWVLQSHQTQDPMLQDIADTNNVTIISTGYRLAPEHPFPAGPNDNFDVAEYLIHNSQKDFGVLLGYVGGESAGGHMSMLTVLHLLNHTDKSISGYKLKGMINHFGAFDMTFSPSTFLFHPNNNPKECLIIDKDLMEKYKEVFLPGVTAEQAKSPDISPLYADLEKHRGSLPPACFTVGTADLLLTDTVFMAERYRMAGADTSITLIPGAVHAYINFPKDTGALSEVGLDAVKEFVSKHQ